MGGHTPIEENRRYMVQRWATCGNGKNGTQANVHTKPPRRTHIRTPGDQQNVSINKSQILVAEYVPRRNGLCPRVRRLSTQQDQYAANKSTYIAHIPET